MWFFFFYNCFTVSFRHNTAFTSKYFSVYCLKTDDILLQYDYQNQGMNTKTAFLSNHRLYMDLAICPSNVLYNTKKLWTPYGIQFISLSLF